MKSKTIKDLYLKANNLRKDVLQMIKLAGSGHLGGSFSSAEIITTLYFSEMKLDPKNPNWQGHPERKTRGKEFRERVMNRRKLPICKFCNTSKHISRRLK